MTCVHHWQIGPVQGPVAQGVCRKCGAVREFATSFREGFSPKSVKKGGFKGKVVMP